MIAILLAAAGVASHWLYYIRGEHHMNAHLLFYFYSALIIALLIYEIQKDGQTCIEAAQGAALLVGAHTVPLFTSIIIYRPSEITAFVPEALPALDGPGNTCTKAAWYDLVQPLRALNTIRDKSEHDWRRRIWDRGFSTKSLQDYDARIIKYGSQLEQHLARTSGQPVHVNDWFYWFSFDVMGDLALAKSFDMLIDEKWHYAILMMRDFMWLLGPFSPIPWLARLGFGIPGVAHGWKSWIVWCKQRMSERILKDVEKPDVSSWLIKASIENKSLDSDRVWLNGDAITMIVAGSDTVGITLTFVLYHLTQEPKYQDLIRYELSQISSITDVQSLRKLAGLQSVITETLRLHPPVPTGAPRVSGPEGLTIGATYIPPDTTIVVSRYTVARLESAFERAERFIPERWTSRTEMVRDKRAFAPFSQGRYGCVGKNLALNEISYVVALIVSKYDVEFAPGDDGERVWRDMKDEFTAAPGRLDLVFNLRR
ncbi:cytochrome P450 [Usnea florida]